MVDVDGGDAEARARGPRREHSEDHWAVVLKKLAPQGYHRSPAWQQEIIERVVKKMTVKRAKSECQLDSVASKEQLARTIDLAALGVSSEAAEVFRMEEQRILRTMQDLPGPGNGNMNGAKGGVGASTGVLPVR